MTRAHVFDRIRDELAAWAEGSDELVTLDEFDDLRISIDVALDECRGFLEQQFGSDKERALDG